ncbi:GIY-YIG nuclease family protein [Peptostreptococcus faecalis]|uniref:GIY-YIG nuclease family protein n=1 Tax=Peptostreptococcus faecalis TaxID=2045015 RepID=UPI000C7992A5|nr:GIY-YIG nuclease family protein [Peptostreptococcus faecalis]
MIKFIDLIQTTDMEKTKIKFHKNEGGDITRPAYDMLMEDEDTWDRMNGWRSNNNNHNLDQTKYLIGMAQYYPYGNDFYIFGGLYEVDKNHSSKYDVQGYTLKKVEEYEQYEKRLIIKINDPRKLSLSYLRLYENAQDDLDMEVYEISSATKLKSFTGYQNVSLTHKDLVKLVKYGEPSYKQALSNVKGIYVITDIKTGKLYIGSASGNADGIWQRWSNYADSNQPTGGNKVFDYLHKKNKNYISENFKYSILEIFDTKTKQELILERENYWKKVFETKKHGMNEN